MKTQRPGNFFAIGQHRTRVNPGLVAAFRYFRQHSGGTAAYALQLARADRYIKLIGFVIVWENDPACDLGDHEDWCAEARRSKAQKGGAPVAPNCNHEIEGCRIYERRDEPKTRTLVGDERASLWGIIDASHDYRRVVEAELACQVMAEENEAIIQLIEQWERGSDPELSSLSTAEFTAVLEGLR